MKSLCTAAVLLALVAAALPAQDTTTTAAYPWRLSYFPYLTVSPNDGVMAMAHLVWFRPSRWDDRVSVADQVALDGGYSTRNSWLLRARGDFPELSDGWRLQTFAEAARDAEYLPGNLAGQAATREIAGVEVTRRLHGRLLLALRAEAMHLDIPADSTVLAITTGTTETDARARLALVYDHRDREYDTRSGVLLQGGAFLCSDGSGCGGFYAIGSAWIPFGATTRATIRTGFRDLDGRTVGIDVTRMVPGWEDEFVLGGGPESNRALPIGEHAVRDAQFTSAEIRHDLKVFPGGAIAVLAFVDAVSTGDDSNAGIFQDETVGVGGGVALRLLRNAVLTATLGRAEHATRLYISSGWAW